eukprot:1573248-Ditylum_brightwellii.AAC.1
MKEHVDLVWSNTGHRADNLKYFEVYGASLPGDTTASMAKRNARKLKHLMFGKLLWNSFTSKFQEKFKRGGSHDRVLL